MIPQPYELWCAEDLDDGYPPILGRVIGWQETDPVDPATVTLDPVVVFEDTDGPDRVDTTGDVWFLGSTRQEALDRAQKHAAERDRKRRLRAAKGVGTTGEAQQ